MKRSLPGSLQIAGGLDFEHRNETRKIGRASVAHSKVDVDGRHARFFKDFSSHGRLFVLSPRRNASRKANSTPVISPHNKKLISPTDDGQRRPERSEYRKGP